jgi:hypothetical protein
MTPQTPERQPDEHGVGSRVRAEQVDTNLVSDASLLRLADAVSRLGHEGGWFVDALTEAMLALRPVNEGRLTPDQERYLVESGDFTYQELARAQRNVDRGELHYDTLQAWMTQVLSTVSLYEMAELLQWSKRKVSDAAARGKLYAIEIAGRPRFPIWQLSLDQESRLLPGLDQVLGSIREDQGWVAISMVMALPHNSLISGGRQSPVEFLHGGGNPGVIARLVSNDHLWW